MLAFFILGISAFLICLVATPLCRDLFVRYNLVDHPDEDRKFHLRAVPRMGGVPIVLSYGLAIGVAFLFNFSKTKLYVQHELLFYAVLPAAAIVFATGLLDDIKGLRPRTKLAGQLAGAILAVSLGARLSITHVHPVVSGVISVIWLIACSNAVNLIDGMDGLATGVGLLATMTTLLVALLSGNYGLALATVPLAGCLLAFLRYNFSPASVFLGDCGSLTIGFVLGCFGLVWSHRTGTMVGMVAPIMALSLPLIDVALAIGRRFLRSVPIFQGDRGHIHHRVLALGFSTRATALLLYAVCGIAASLAILESFIRPDLSLPIIVIFCFLVLVGIDRLGYVEFEAFRKVLTHTVLRSTVKDHIFIEELNRKLRHAETLDQWWIVVCNACEELDFTSAHLELNGYEYSEQFSASDATCRIHLDLDDDGFLLLTRSAEEAPRNMMAVLQQLQTSLKDLAPLIPAAVSPQKVSSVKTHAA